MIALVPCTDMGKYELKGKNVAALVDCTYFVSCCLATHCHNLYTATPLIVLIWLLDNKKTNKHSCTLKMHDAYVR